MNTLWQAISYSAPQDEDSGLEFYPRWTLVVLAGVAWFAALGILFGP